MAAAATFGVLRACSHNRPLQRRPQKIRKFQNRWNFIAFYSEHANFGRNFSPRDQALIIWAAFLAASLALLPVFPSIATTCRAMISRFFAEFLQAENKEFSVQYPEYSGESIM